MAQREQHERVKRMDRWAEKLLGHKAVVVAILVAIAAASGLAMANFGGHPATCRLSVVTRQAPRMCEGTGMCHLMMPMSRLPRVLLPPRCTSMWMAPL